MLHLSDRLYRCYAMLTNVSSHTRTTHGRTYAHTQINQMRENEIRMQTKRQSQPRRDLIRRTDDSFFLSLPLLLFSFSQIHNVCVCVLLLNHRQRYSLMAIMLNAPLSLTPSRSLALWRPFHCVFIAKSFTTQLQIVFQRFGCFFLCSCKSNCHTRWNCHVTKRHLAYSVTQRR